MKTLVALASGILFGVGLSVSGMVNPAKVTGFLDFAGEWDATLAFVMVGALLVSVPAFRLILARPRPVLESVFDLPQKTTLDGRLLGGAALFGVGWGISGFCPGPAVAALASGLPSVFVFVGAMLAGMVVYESLFS